jgi:hypothetical protein
MIFFPLSLVSIGVAFGALLFIALTGENALLTDFIDSRPLKTFAIWLLCVNSIGLIALFLLSVIVPKPKVIWYNLIYVWITSLIGIVGSNPAFLYLSDGQRSLQIGQTEDILGVVAILVGASLFSAWRVEILAKTA